MEILFVTGLQPPVNLDLKSMYTVQIVLACNKIKYSKNKAQKIKETGNVHGYEQCLMINSAKLPAW